MPYAPVDNAEIYYEEAGVGPPLILVSGLGGLGAFWSRQVCDFSRTFRVITFDHRGAGRSTHSQVNYSVEQMANDTMALMDHVGIASAHYVGHSTGGAIGMTIAQDSPDRLASLVLSATWPGADPYFRRMFEIRKELLIHRGFESYWRASVIMQRPPRWISENDAFLEQEMRNVASVAPNPEILISRIDAILRFDRRQRLSEIRCPTLVIVADDDILTPRFYSEELAHRIPGAELKVLGSGGHFVPTVVPREYNTVVGTFLRAQADQ